MFVVARFRNISAQSFKMRGVLTLASCPIVVSVNI